MVISVRQKNVFYSQPFLKMRKFLLDMRKDFLIMSKFYLVEILSEPNSLTIVASKKILKMSNYVLILSIFFLIMRIMNLQWRYYGKERNFNWIGWVKKLENSDRKDSYFFNFCSSDFTVIVFFALVIAPQFISSQGLKIMEKLLSSYVEH